MIIANFWAQAKKTIEFFFDGKERVITLQRWGWSDANQEEAEKHALKRLEEAETQWRDQRFQKPRSFWNKFKSEPKVAYNGAEGTPIREEILQNRGTVGGVLTRNSYGAKCLNTENMLIADIDRMTFRSDHILSLLIVLSVLVPFSTFLFLKFGLVQSIFSGLVVALPLFFTLKTVVWNLYVYFQGGLSGVVQNRLFEEQGLFRLYETPNGFRVIETSRTWDPNHEDTQKLFHRLQVDPLYATMCKKQHCFRARVTGKPWRMGMARMPGGLWPVDDVAKLEKRMEWTNAYDQHALSYSAAKFITSVGDKTLPVDDHISNTLLWHDELSLGEKNLA